MSTAAPHATLYTGLDLHKSYVVASTFDADSTTVAQRKLPTRPDLLALYFAGLPGSGEAEHRAIAEVVLGERCARPASAAVAAGGAHVGGWSATLRAS